MMLDSKDMQQQSKAFDKLTSRIASSIPLASKRTWLPLLHLMKLIGNSRIGDHILKEGCLGGPLVKKTLQP
ncbi:hypothetical protein OROGR_018007 [Orobanche gracilis]